MWLVGVVCRRRVWVVVEGVGSGRGSGVDPGLSVGGC